MRTLELLLLLTVSSLLWAACRAREDSSKDELKLAEALANIDRADFTNAIRILKPLQKSKTIDHFLVADYLAQSYASLSGLDVLAMYPKVQALVANKDAELGARNIASQLFSALPPAKLYQLDLMSHAVEVYDQLNKQYPNHSLVQTHRLLYRGLYLLFLTKGLYVDIKNLVDSRAIGEQLKYLVEISNKGSLLTAEKMMFEVVAITPSLTRKVKKLVKKLIKSGYFSFMYQGRSFVLDFRNRENGGVARLIADFFRMGLEALALKLGLEVADLEMDIEEIEAAIIAIMYGELSVDQGLKRISESSKAKKLIAQALQERQKEEGLEGDASEILARVSWKSILTGDVDGVPSSVVNRSPEIKKGRSTTLPGLIDYGAGVQTAIKPNKGEMGEIRDSSDIPSARIDEAKRLQRERLPDLDTDALNRTPLPALETDPGKGRP